MVEKHVVRNDGVDIAVFEQGNPAGPTVLLLHGWPDTHHLWNNIVPELTERFRVLSVDNRGHGESSNPPGTKAISVANFAADYVTVIEALGKGEPVHVLAHDWGSIAMWEVVARPDAHRLVASFTSVSGPSLAHTASWARSRLARPTPRNIALPLAQLGSFAYSGVFSLPVLPQAVIAAGVSEERWRTWLSRAEERPPTRSTWPPRSSRTWRAACASIDRPGPPIHWLPARSTPRFRCRSLSAPAIPRCGSRVTPMRTTGSTRCGCAWCGAGIGCRSPIRDCSPRRPSN